MAAQAAAAAAPAVEAAVATPAAAAADEAGQKKKKKKTWVPLESNPEAINKYTKRLGMPEDSPFAWFELFSCEEWAQGMVPGPHHAVMLNFPIVEAVLADEAKERETIEANGQTLDDGIFFTNQTVGNACGTVGIIHAVSNNQPKIAVGGWFASFFADCRGKTPMERASILEDSDELDEAHAEGAADESNSSAEDANLNNHFITFVCKGGALIELDGRKPWPVNHGPTTPDTLLADACTLIQSRFFSRDQGGRFAMTVLASKASE